MAIVDRHGLPLAVSTHAANHHDVTLVQLSFDFCMIDATPENLIGDRAYDSDRLHAQLREEGIEMIAPHKSNRTRRKTQDGRRLRRYERRWIVERFFSWLQWQRRLLVRWEYYAANFLGFVQLASIVILLKRFGDRFYLPLGWVVKFAQNCAIEEDARTASDVSGRLAHCTQRNAFI